MLSRFVIVFFFPKEQASFNFMAAVTVCRDLLETQILGTHLRPTESETVEVGPRNLFCDKLSR